MKQKNNDAADVKDCADVKSCADERPCADDTSCVDESADNIVGANVDETDDKIVGASAVLANPIGIANDELVDDNVPLAPPLLHGSCVDHGSTNFSSELSAPN